MLVQKQIDHLLAQRASEWVEILKRGSEAERAAFIEWLAESKLHVQEFLDITAVDRELDGIDPECSEDVEALIAEVSPYGNVSRTREAASAGHPPRRAWRRFAIAATVGLVVMGGLALQGYFSHAQKFSTRIGEQRAIALADTSLVTLNVDSRIEVDLRDTERTVELLRGEAMFKVAPDAARPFRVRTRMGVIQAVGTQFNVYDLPEGTRVSVLEGRVKVMPFAGAASEEPQFLEAGEEILLEPGGAVQRPTHLDVARTLAWRERRLVFDTAALEDVVREFNRYNPAVRIELHGIPPGSYHYDGIFDADDPASLATLLQQEPGLTVRMDDGNYIVSQSLQ